MVRISNCAKVHYFLKTIFAISSSAFAFLTIQYFISSNQQIVLCIDFIFCITAMSRKNIVIKGNPLADVQMDLSLLPTLLAKGRIKTDELLNHVDIIAAIGYYGITELLDIIGEEEIKSYLALQGCTRTHP